MRTTAIFYAVASLAALLVILETHKGSTGGIIGKLVLWPLFVGKFVILGLFEAMEELFGGGLR